MPEQLRPELQRPIPPRILALPVHRGYPVPWFVAWLADGTPEFRAMDRVKWARAVRERRCWVCGEPLGRHLTFVLGPMCGVNRTSSEPPSHRDCATWSARNCPFLTRPHMVRREDETLNTAELERQAAGFAIARNPGVALVWTTSAYKVYKAEAGGAGYLIEIGEPEHVEWYAEGRPATREEVAASVDSGLPLLDEKCELERVRGGAIAVMDARRALGAAHERLRALYPPAMAVAR
jgi:hypothetical protein